MVDEEGLPDRVRLLRFGHRPELVVGQIELPETLRNQVVVDEQFIDAPEKQLSERRVVEMRMDVVNRSACDDIGDSFAKSGGGGHDVHVNEERKKLQGKLGIRS